MNKAYWLKLWIQKLQKEINHLHGSATVKKQLMKDLKDELKYKRFEDD